MSTKQPLGFVHPVLGEAPGHYVALSRGVTHFNIYKPANSEENAKYIFCGHGLGGNLRDFTGIGEKMSEKGYTVITYDYYGRGWSRIDSDDRSPVWDEDLYYNQAIELWEKLGLIESPFIWMGYSTGGAVGVLLASRKPRLVRSIVFIAPAICPSIARPHPCLQFCGLYIFCCFDCPSKAYKRATKRYWFDDDSDGARMAKSRVSQSIHQYPPYMEAIQSTCLHLFSQATLTRILQDYKLLSQQVLLIWGRGDCTTPFEQSETLSKLKTSRLVVLDDAKHGILIERPQEVIASITKFIDEFEANDGYKPRVSHIAMTFIDSAETELSDGLGSAPAKDDSNSNSASSAIPPASTSGSVSDVNAGANTQLKS